MLTRELIESAVLKARLARKGEVRGELYDFALDALNRNYKVTYDRFPWDNIKIFNLTKTVTTADVILPEFVEIVRAVRIDLRPLFPLNELIVNNFAPELFTEAGTPQTFDYRPDSPLLIPPAAATTLRVFSSDVADTLASALVVRIEGTVGSEDDFEELTLNGTTAVVSTKSFTAVRSIFKPDTDGRITIDDGVLVLGTIAPWHNHAHYKTIALQPPPDVSTTVTLQCTRRFQKLISDNDGTIIPDADSALIDDLTAELLESEKEEKRAIYYRNKADLKLAILAKRDLEHQSKDIVINPENGMFGELGDEQDGFRDFDISATGFNST